MGTANDDVERSGRITSRAAARPYLTQYEQGGVWVVAAYGAFDLNSVPLLVGALQEATVTHATVVVDAAGFTFADSTVLSALLAFRRCHDLRLARPAHNFQRVLELTGADQVLDIRPTVNDAITP
ncbi:MULTISPECIES: STAS domain-containing protein [unclassified Streptomyces]|uniref:STAS domain-containing protein n=1 Tax=unclassified Streptomyces TaxID=2593676 RepID=UPI003821D8C1